MICHAGITLLTDGTGNPTQVNIDLRRHGKELAAFLLAHGLAEPDGELRGTLTGGALVPQYRPLPSGLRHFPVVYRAEVKRFLHRAVERMLASSRNGDPDRRDEYTVRLLRTLERHLHAARRRRIPAPKGYERYGHDMFCVRFRLRLRLDTLWTVCYTLCDETAIVRYIGAETKK